MAKISGWIFTAIGAGVALFSRYVQKRGGDGLGLFFWTGIVMIGIGIFKMVVGFIMNDKKAQEERDSEKNQKSMFRYGFNKDLERVDSSEILKEKQRAMNSVQESSIIVCPNCGTKHYSNSNFCHMCGRKLK